MKSDATEHLLRRLGVDQRKLKELSNEEVNLDSWLELASVDRSFHDRLVVLSKKIVHRTVASMQPPMVPSTLSLSELKTLLADSQRRETSLRRLVAESRQLDQMIVEADEAGYVLPDEVRRLQDEAGKRALERLGEWSDYSENVRYGIERVREEIESSKPEQVDVSFDPAPAPKEVARMCANCGRRPRHFDDLCKRCANEDGLRPKGKV